MKKRVLVASWVLALGLAGAAGARQRLELLPTARVRVESGLNVEILGITESPGAGGVWWSVEGKSLRTPPVVLPSRKSGEHWRGVRELAIAVRLTPPNVPMSSGPVLSRVSATFEGGKRLAPQAFAVCVPERPLDTSVVYFAAPDGARRATFQLGVLFVGGKLETAEFKNVALRPAPR